MLPYRCYADVVVQDKKCSLIHTFKDSIHFNIISFHPITFTQVCKFNVFLFDKAEVKKKKCKIHRNRLKLVKKAWL